MYDRGSAIDDMTAAAADVGKGGRVGDRVDDGTASVCVGWPGDEVKVAGSRCAVDE